MSRLCDVSTEALEQARQLVDLPHQAMFADYQAPLEQRDGDCVIICAPNRFTSPRRGARPVQRARSEMETGGWRSSVGGE